MRQGKNVCREIGIHPTVLGVFSFPANGFGCVSVCQCQFVGGTGRIGQIKVGQLIRSLVLSTQEMIHIF